MLRDTAARVWQTSSAASVTAAPGRAGGTGIELYNDALYAEVNDRIVRYPLPAGTFAPDGRPTVVVWGLPLEGDHPMHHADVRAVTAFVWGLSHKNPLAAH